MQMAKAEVATSSMIRSGVMHCFLALGHRCLNKRQLTKQHQKETFQILGLAIFWSSNWYVFAVLSVTVYFDIATVEAPDVLAFQHERATVWTSQNSRGPAVLTCLIACQVVPQNKGRPATVKGLCIAKKNRGWRTSFTVLNYIQGGGPVERTFPLCAFSQPLDVPACQRHHACRCNLMALQHLQVRAIANGVLTRYMSGSWMRGVE